jgi:hypothetical protein
VQCGRYARRSHDFLPIRWIAARQVWPSHHIDHVRFRGSLLSTPLCFDLSIPILARLILAVPAFFTSQLCRCPPRRTGMPRWLQGACSQAWLSAYSPPPLQCSFRSSRRPRCGAAWALSTSSAFALASWYAEGIIGCALFSPSTRILSNPAAVGLRIVQGTGLLLAHSVHSRRACRGAAGSGFHICHAIQVCHRSP